MLASELNTASRVRSDVGRTDRPGGTTSRRPRARPATILTAGTVAGATVRSVPVARQIVCVDCGGDAFLVRDAPEDDPWLEGDVVTYRCRDCLERWDLVVAADDLE
jgi:hypothetical protein